MGRLKNVEKHELAATVIKYLKTTRPELTNLEVRRVFITAYHDLSKLVGDDER